MNIADIIKLDNLLITAVDKHYWKYLKFFPKDTEIVIHDPTECKSAKDINPLIESKDGIDPLLSIFQVKTIRESVQDYLMKTFNFKSEFKISSILRISQIKRKRFRNRIHKCINCENRF